jgi:hypothetical protein
MKKTIALAFIALAILVSDTLAHHVLSIFFFLLCVIYMFYGLFLQPRYIPFARISI